MEDRTGTDDGAVAADTAATHTPSAATNEPAGGTTIRVAAVQLTSGPERDSNLATAESLVRAAADEGAALVVLPEYTSVLGSGAVLRSGAEPLDGPTTTWARTIAAELGIWLLAGSFPEHHPDTDKTSNTSVLLSPTGEIAACYRKIHLFDCEVSGAEFHESSVIRAGDQIVTCEMGPATLGMSICYDLRFAELYRILALRGSTIVAVPSAFTARTGRDHWEVLLRARAIENQCFVIAAAQTGSSGAGLNWHGQSMIIDPWGTVVAKAPAATDSIAEAVITADLDLAELDRIRGELPSLANRRPSTYRWPGAAT